MVLLAMGELERRGWERRCGVEFVASCEAGARNIAQMEQISSWLVICRSH